MNEIVNKDQLERQAQRIAGASQATGIEQSRAIAEVQAAVAVAQRFRRNEAEAIRESLSACAQMSVAERAFYSFPRGGQTVNGPSIALAVELARCWGNIDYGIMELERDDEAGHTEMLAFAWDLQTNTKSRQTFIVPHRRDTRRGAQALTDMRDIYENNANNGARRLRECIFRVLPAYLKEQAERTCHHTLEKGEGDAPLPERIARTISVFEGMGVSSDRLEQRFGPSSGWTPPDLANLHVSFQSIKRGETTIDEAFPKEGIGDTAERVKALAKSEPKQEGGDSGPEEEEAPPPSAEMSDEAQETLNDIDGPLDEGEPEKAAEEGGEGEEGPDARELKFEEIKKALQGAANIIDLNNVKDRYEQDLRALTEEQQGILNRIAGEMERALRGRADKAGEDA